MPDPLLDKFDFDADYSNCQRTASFYGATLRRDGAFVYIECGNLRGRTLLARIDCSGYPVRQPTFVFLNPSTKMVSANRAHWPTDPAPRQTSAGLRICMSVPVSYVEGYGTLVPRYSLAQLVEVLILLCRGQGHILREIGRR